MLYLTAIPVLVLVLDLLPSLELAEARLFQKIGEDARRWRYKVKETPHEP